MAASFAVVGHRGSGKNSFGEHASYGAMENSVRSFNEAARLGAEVVEFDVQVGGTR